jgi:hypothetical protein
MTSIRYLLGVVLASACGIAAAQDDPLFAEESEAVEADDDDGFDWLGDLLLRRDQVNGLANRAPVDRFRARARFGFRYTTGEWEFGAAAEASQGSDANKDNRINNDNERSDDANLDQAYARWTPSDATAITLGKTLFPLSLTPLTWDNDLRPIGASVDHSIGIGELDRLRLVGGYFAGDHLYGDDSRIAAAQATWFIREGAPWSGEVSIGYLDFDDLDDLARNGLGRTNRRAAGRYVSDYELLDLQFALRASAWEVPFEARLDLVRNLGADDRRDAARFSTIFGRADIANAWELGLAYERIQRDAVLAAFNADDWWFHSFARGFMPWLAYGITDNVSVRLAGFFERRDDQPDNIDRLLLDVRAVW